MEFRYGKNDWKDLVGGQAFHYLLTNRRGGYSTASIIDSLSRNEQNLLMAAVKAPNQWIQFVARLETVVATDAWEESLSSQEYVDHTKNQMGWQWLDSFVMDPVPEWIHQIRGIRIRRRIVMKYEENLVCVQCEMENRSGQSAQVHLRPWLRFTPKGVMPERGQVYTVGETSIESGGLVLHYATDGTLRHEEDLYLSDLYFRDDARDGRSAVGSMHANHCLAYSLAPGEARTGFVIYSLAPIRESAVEIMENELARKRALLDAAGVSSPLGRQLVLAADQFVVDRDSTGGRTIIAGYPFFGDWGRDTMIAVLGCCIATGRAQDARSIFRTFMRYLRRGLMPNMFPEGEAAPMYNTVDASLLFINAVHEYHRAFGDEEMVREAMPAMLEIIDWYERGTDFHIRMDEDGLIMAGDDLEQVTWMDIRIGDHLPTPRHGKPVEINAYWYNALRILADFARMTDMGDAERLDRLSEKVRTSFQRAFWNETTQCLRDVVSGNPSDDQIRCNQIWALSLPYTMLDQEQSQKVLDTVYQHLYTPYGLRSLSPEDPEYKPFYGGTLWDRDTAYHQGTVWAFPLGAYYLAYLKVHDHSPAARCRVREDLLQLCGTLREGSIGQIAEIFDGDHPSVSKGCFAQAWSVGELLRVVVQVEE